MKTFLHVLVLAVFAIGCFCAWGILTVVQQQAQHLRFSLPGFTALCVNLRPLLMALPILAAGYCVWVWTRKADRVPSWIGFFAGATGGLVVVALPTMVAAYLPLVALVNLLVSK
jgi:hypothetical protein